jgi:hypothetical protein
MKKVWSPAFGRPSPHTCLTALFAAAILTASSLAQLPEQPEQTTLKTTKVSLESDGRALSSVLEDLSNQAGIRLSVDNTMANTSVSIRASERPFWETFMAALYPTNKDGTFAFQVDDGSSYSGTRYTGKTYVSGPFLVLANRVVHQADYRRAEGDAELFYVEMQVLVDPALRGMFVEGNNLPTKAVDDAGTSLVLEKSPGPRIVPIGPSRPGPDRAAPARVLLARPAKPAQLGRKLASLQGDIAVTIADDIEKVELTVPGKTEATIAGIKCQFETKVSSNGGVEISSHFDRPDSMSDDDWNAADQRLFCTRQRVYDAAGKAWPPSGGAGASYGVKVRSMSESFTRSRPGFGRGGADAGEAAKAVVEVIKSVKVVKVPYRFGDLVLP